MYKPDPKICANLQMGKFQYATESKSKNSQYKSPAHSLYQSKSVRPAASLFNHSTYSHDALLNGTSPNDQKMRKRRKKSQRMRRCLAVLYTLCFHTDTLRGKLGSGASLVLLFLILSNTCSEPTPATQSPRDPCSGLQGERKTACAPQGAKGSEARQKALEPVIVAQTVGVCIHMQSTPEASCQSRDAVRST
ncbi:hypothetical protein DPX16_16008 [Anabarilius grahami]|uniref:Uncharacterized protein n=1 Tax=Anabarilius grahami TaxID=495550 RepID=A0A3N0YU14_ANAGA|nr:hypothetical protein DPX16_16008 [Anabarilius grahami]